MDRRDYTDRVLSSLRRVTEKEREAIRSELDGHIEDHMEALRELGYDEELAEERAIAAMGEPDEVGRELNRQYTGWGWVLVSRAGFPISVDCRTVQDGICFLHLRSMRTTPRKQFFRKK